MSSAYATQRKMTHDFRHHIAALSGMLQGGETQQAQDYLAALQEQQTERALMVNTHNSAIDAVLNYEKHDYIFFCARPEFDGYHNFAKTLREHNKNARAYSDELNRRKIK